MTRRRLIFATLALTLAGELRSAAAQEDAAKSGADKVHEVGGGLQIKGELGDEKDITYKVRLSAGKTYAITMTSPNPLALDPYLFLLDEAGKKLAEDDDSGGNQNSLIMFPAEAAGTYQIVASRFAGKGSGPFTLSVREGTDEMAVQAKQRGPRPAGAGFDMRRMILGMVGMYAFPVLLFLMCAITMFVCLIKRGTRDWFRLAGLARREHREMLSSLRD